MQRRLADEVQAATALRITRDLSQAIAAPLAGHVIPNVHLRQLKLALPILQRVLLGAQPKLVAAVMEVMHPVNAGQFLGQARLNDSVHGGDRMDWIHSCPPRLYGVQEGLGYRLLVRPGAGSK